MLVQSDRHYPWALQTRWDITVNVNDAPVGMNFVMIEIGSEPFCGTSSCSESIAFFGLSTVQGADVQLRSYKSNATANLVKLLHTKATDRSPLIQFDEMQPDDVTVLYHHYPHNSSFYGVGGGVWWCVECSLPREARVCARLVPGRVQ